MAARSVLFRTSTAAASRIQHRHAMRNGNQNHYVTRLFSSKEGQDKDIPPILESSKASARWRKQQLEEVERKINEPSVEVVESDEDLQPMWSEMESRVTRRRPRTKAQTGNKTGRANVKRTDEEFWLREGVYQDDK